MSKLYKTREGGSTVTIFVPYDCCNNCPFCINKAEYANNEGFSAEKIIESIKYIDSVTPYCDIVFTGGEPLADLECLQTMLDAVPTTHKVFINTTLPVMHKYSEEQVVEFLNRNIGKLTCVNVSRHLEAFVEEGSDEIFAKIKVPTRINCVLFADYPSNRIEPFIKRFQKYGVPIQFRSDYTKTTLENLYDESDDPIMRDLEALCEFEEMWGCRIRCNYEYDYHGHHISYHKTLPYSTIPEVGEDGVEYDVLYDILIKQTGVFHSDWTGVLLDCEKYEKVVYEPYDLCKRK